MGIVRDITVEELKQAVNNIDTSTLAQDSTLQDVVTAIQNISGGSDPVTNTTVNTLGKDTTLQNIASAISGLGQILGADKANISGDNIANPSTFRTNIGLTYDFIQSNDTRSIASSTNNFYTLTNKITLTGGIWLISYWAQFSDNAIGVRILTLSDSQNSASDIVYSKITNDAVGSSALTRMGNIVIFNTGGLSYDIYLNANQNSGSNMTVTGVLRALRLVN